MLPSAKLGSFLYWLSRMAFLIECRDCGHEVSKSAEACPNCGKRLKRRWYEIGPFTTKVMLGGVALMVLVSMCESG